MKTFYLYWVHPGHIPTSDVLVLLESALNTTIHVDWGKDHSVLTIDDGSAEMIATLLSLQDVLSSDYPIELSLYLTPRLDVFFEQQAVQHRQQGIHDVGRLVMQMVQQGTLSSQVVKAAFPELTKEQRDTIIAYLWSGFNASLAARHLYLHRNSYTYRMNQLIQATGWEIRYAHVIMFLSWLLFI